MLMSLPEVFPNPGPITSTPKKPTASPITMRITTKNTSDDEADMIHTLTCDNHSRPGSADHQLQVRSCPVSPIGSKNPVSQTDCQRSPSAQHAPSTAESAPAPAVVVETDETNLTSPVLTGMGEQNNSTSSLPSSDEVETKLAAPRVVVRTTKLVETAAQTNTLPVTDDSCSLSATPLIPGYRTVQNHLKTDPKSIKQRLLSALTDMIPHRETLSLRLLVNYTIDDKDSECVVIDETLCRQKDSVGEKKSHGKRGPDNSIPTDRDDSGFCSELSETEAKRLKCERLSTTNEAHVLDLSLHTEREDQELNEAMITEQEDSSDSQSASFLGQRLQLSSDPRSTVTSTDGLSTATNVSNILSSTSTLPFLDSTVLTLLPFLQQQQQQQQQQQPQQQRQGFSFAIPAKPPVASMNSVSANSMGSTVPETAEMILLKELQALLNAPNGTLQPGTTTLQLNPLRTLGNNVAPSTTTTAAAANDASTTAAAAAAAAAAALELGGTNGLGSHSRTSLTSTSSLPSALTSSPLIGFPLLHPFGTDNMTAVQALLPTSTPNFTSFNFSPTAVLSLKDKTNGFDQPIGSKTFSPPMVSSLNPITVPQTGSLSLRTTLSTLSQLFTGSTADGSGQNIGSVSVSNMLESNGTETKRLSLDALTASLTGGLNESKLSNLSSSGSTMEVLGKQILLKTLDLSAVGQTKHTNHETEPNGPRTGMRFNRTLVTGTSSPTTSSILTSAMTNNISNSGTTAQHTNSTEHTAKSLSTAKTAPTALATAATATATSTTGTTLPTSNGSYSTGQFAFGRRLTNTRRFVCNQCRKNFASLAELNRHTLEAHNSFKCTICSAHFTQRSNLQRHSLKHVGFKPFTCNLCKKEYYRKDHLVRHIEVTHPNHDPKMNITVHLTSSECLDYLDRLHAGKQTPSSNGSTEFRETTEEDPEELIDLEEMRIEDPAASGIELTETDQTGVCDEGSSPMTEND